MKAILIDDEPLALKELQRQLEQIPGIRVSSVFSNAIDAMKSLKTLKPDIAFLDIHMPEINGLEAAEMFTSQLPGIHLVFLTAYNDYAVQAFELNAVDYLLKPINPERLAKTVSRLESIHSGHSHTGRNPLMIRCFHHLHLDVDSSSPISWRTAKAQELFAYLLHCRNETVSKEHLIEQLWPAINASKGYVQLYGSIYQIRKTLESIGLPVRIENTQTGYSLKLNQVKLDVEEWEHAVRAAPPLTDQTLYYHMNCFDNYSGDYLGEHDYLWAEPERERLRQLWGQFSLLLADYLIQSQCLKKALYVYHRIREIFPLEEQIYWEIMKIYAHMNDWSAVEKQYAELKQILLEELDIQPNEQIQSWIENCRRNSHG